MLAPNTSRPIRPALSEKVNGFTPGAVILPRGAIDESRRPRRPGWAGGAGAAGSTRQQTDCIPPERRGAIHVHNCYYRR